MNDAHPPPSGAVFWLTAAVGAALIGLGVGGLLATQEIPRIVNAAAYLGGAIVVHDALLAPLALLVGVLVTRLAPAIARPVVAAALVVSATVAVATAPVWLERGRARYPDNTTILPDASYRLNLALVLGAIWLAALVVIGVRVRRSRRLQISASQM
jgi:hypothetical protein